MVYETFVSFYTMGHDLKICFLPGFVFKEEKKKESWKFRTVWRLWTYVYIQCNTACKSIYLEITLMPINMRII